MRTGAVIIVVWLLVGVFAAYQRNYFSSGDNQVNCAEFGTVALTIVAGPLNYFGVNPKINCEVPQPSQ
jgi:hypothetical protein